MIKATQEKDIVMFQIPSNGRYKMFNDAYGWFCNVSNTLPFSEKSVIDFFKSLGWKIEIDSNPHTYFTAICSDHYQIEMSICYQDDPVPDVVFFYKYKQSKKELLLSVVVELINRTMESRYMKYVIENSFSHSKQRLSHQ